MTKDERIRLLIGNARATAENNRENLSISDEAILEIADMLASQDEVLMELATMISDLVTGGETA